MLFCLSHPERLFDASALYILDKSFDSVQLIKPSLDEHRSRMYAVCTGFKSKEMVPVLKASMHKLRQSEDVSSLIDTTLVTVYAQGLSDNLNPLWQQQIDAMKKVYSSLPIGRLFRFEHTMDQKGIVFHLTKGNHRNQESGIRVSSSGCAIGEPNDFINREKTRCWTTNAPNSWYCLDVGEDRRVLPSHYTLGYASSGNSCCPRNWILQASKQIITIPEKDTLPQNDPSWKTLAIHTNDNSLHADWAVNSWKLNTSEPFRYFRIVQTGSNTYSSSGGGGEDSWSKVLVVNRFELYGTVITADKAASLSGVSSAMKYGGDATFVTRAPPIIRADPHVTKELHQFIIQVMRPDLETKAERVVVHDIVL